jgi:hypothetical protein
VRQVIHFLLTINSLVLPICFLVGKKFIDAAYASFSRPNKRLFDKITIDISLEKSELFGRQKYGII